MSAHPSVDAPATRMGVTPLWAVLTFTFLNSVGSAVVYAGVFFLAKAQYDFSQRDNFALALLYGLTYIPAALAVGPLTRKLARAGIKPRTVLRGIMISMAALCVLPWLAQTLGLVRPGGSAWPIWLAVGLYSPLSGMLWPIVESFLAGGRSERQLRGDIGKFNIAWSSSLVVTLLVMGPLVQQYALWILNALALVHLSCLVVVQGFRPAPGEHAHEKHESPKVYHQLLAFLRLMLPVSFMFVSTLSPYVPFALEQLKLAMQYHTPFVAIWYAARVLTFFAMERWHGWHGRWSVPIIGALILLASFAVLIAAPMLLDSASALIVFAIGLIGFGIGVGVIYCAALYYAMEVGSDGVDAGGMHETLIGLGYSVGPMCGLLGLGVVAAGLAGSDAKNSGDTATLIMLAVVAVLSLGVGGLALWRARRTNSIPSH
ncbi:MAG: MFS transporter [Phycisphaerales bacterium]|nr:MFS transporter [Phycisphaerales bacterium]